MGRSDRGYVDPDRESKRARNLKKLEKRKKDTGEVKRFPRKISITDSKRLKSLENIRDGFLIREKAKRKSLRIAEREHNRFEAERLRKELYTLKDSREKTLREQLAKVPESSVKLQQEILKLGRQKKLLQSRAPTDLDSTRKAILYVEGQKKYLEAVLTGKARPEAKKVLNTKRTIKELLEKKKSSPIPPKIPRTPPPPPSPEPTIDFSGDKSKRIAKMNLRIRNIQREIKYLEGEVAKRSKKIGERIGAKRRDGSIVGETKKGKGDKLEDFYKQKLKLQKEVQFLINEKKNEDRKRSLRALEKTSRSGSPLRRGRREQQKLLKLEESRKRSGYSSAYHLARRSGKAKYNERVRNPLKVMFLIMVNQEEYDNIISNNWLGKVSGYHDFGIGIASVNKISFNRGDACDIYVDISEIASTFQSTSDITQEAKDKIQLLCKEKLGSNIAVEFFYVSSTGVPFERPPKIICVMPIHQRELVTIETVNRLKQQKYLDDIILIGDSPVEQRIAAKTGVSYVEYFNNPLSWKVQVGVDVARDCNPDAIMISGSDDWLSQNWCEACAPFIPTYDIIGSNRWWIVRVEKNRPLELLACSYPHRKDLIGAGRIISARSLDKIGWALYTFKRESGLDHHSWMALSSPVRGPSGSKRGAAPQGPAGHKKGGLPTKIVDNIITIGIKGEWEQIDPFVSVRTYATGQKAIIDPEAWLDLNFPGWDKSFARFEPTFKRKG